MEKSRNNCIISTWVQLYYPVGLIAQFICSVPTTLTLICFNIVKYLLVKHSKCTQAALPAIAALPRLIWALLLDYPSVTNVTLQTLDLAPHTVLVTSRLPLDGGHLNWLFVARFLIATTTPGLGLGARSLGLRACLFNLNSISISVSIVYNLMLRCAFAKWLQNVIQCDLRSAISSIYYMKDLWVPMGRTVCTWPGWGFWHLICSLSRIYMRAPLEKCRHRVLQIIKANKIP